MIYAKINASGCEIRKLRIKLRLDFFLDATEPNYDKHHLFVVDWSSPEAQAGYPGAVNEAGEPIDSAAYQAWEDSLPHVWVDTPFHAHMLHPLHTASDDAIRAEIVRCLSYFYAFTQHCWDNNFRFTDEWKKVAVKDGEVRCPIAEGTSKDKKKSENRLADILSRISEFDVGISATKSVNLRIGERGTIDVGSAVGDFNNWSEINGYTQVEGANTANASGTIDTIEVQTNTATVGNIVKGGILTESPDNYLTPRDTESLGGAVQGYNIFTGLDIDVETGDVIGITETAGKSVRLERQTNQGTEKWYASGDFPTQSYTNSITQKLALYGTGTEAAAALIKIASETLGLSEGFAQRFWSFRFTPNTVGLSDSPVRRQWSNRLASATVGLIDGLFRRGRTVRLTPDTVGLTETFVKIISEVRVATTEVISLVDTALRRARSIRPAPEVLGLVDSIVSRMWSIRLAAETLGLAEVVVRRAWAVRIKSTTVGISESFVRTAGQVRLFAEIVGITEALSRVAGAVRLSAETVGISEVVVLRARAIRLLSEILGIPEVVTFRARAIRLSSEIVDISDAAVRRMWSLRFTPDNVTIVETFVKWTTGAVVKIMTEVQGISEVVVRRMWAVRLFAESIGLVDTALRVARAVRIASDTVGITTVLVKIMGIVKFASGKRETFS